MIRLAWRSAHRHRRRALLVSLSAGLGSLMLILSLGLVRASREGLIRNLRIVMTGDVRVTRVIPGAVYGVSPAPVGVPWELSLQETDHLVEALEAHPGVRRVARRISVPCAYLAGPEVLYQGVVFGIEPPREPELRELLPPAAGEFPTADDPFSLYLGPDAADRLNLQVGGNLTLLCRDASGQDAAEDFTVLGILPPGAPWQGLFAFAPLEGVRELVGAGPGEALELLVRLEQPERAQELAPELARVASGAIEGEMDARSHVELGGFYRGMTVANSFLLVVMVATLGLVVGANVLNSMITAVFESRREIGTIRAMGGSRPLVARRFLLEAACLVAPASLVGTLTGALVSAGLNAARWKVPEPAFALMTGSPFLRSTPGLIDLVATVLAMTALGMLAALLPAWSSARMQPVAALRER